MFKTLNYLIFLVLVLSLMGHVQAQDATWTDAIGDHLWSTPDNWSEFPTSAHWAKIRRGAPGPMIVTEGAVALKAHIGYEEESALTVDGGTLTTVEDLLMGKSGGSGTLNMISGVITVGRDLEVGGGHPGIINMTGGTIIVGDDFMLPELDGSTAEVNLDWGTIIVHDDLNMRDGGTLDIRAGALIVDANVISLVQGFVDSGWITAYDGDGTIHMDYDVTNPGQTTVRGVHKLNPFPADGGMIDAGQVELSWTLPDPCTPGQPVPVDVYFTDDYDALWQFLDPAAIRVVSHSNVTSFAVQTAPKTRYFWAADTYIGDPNDPILGPIFSFVADNVAPAVNVCDDVTTWLVNGIADVSIGDTVTDVDPFTVAWTVVSEPNEGMAVIAHTDQSQTTVSLSAVGTYVLQLEADDGEKQGTDSLTLHVYANSCLAAQSLPGYVPLPGDINLDCVVDQADVDLLLEQWLNCNALDCQAIDPVDPIGL